MWPWLIWQRCGWSCVSTPRGHPCSPTHCPLPVDWLHLVWAHICAHTMLLKVSLGMRLPRPQDEVGCSRAVLGWFLKTRCRDPRQGGRFWNGELGTPWAHREQEAGRGGRGHRGGREESWSQGKVTLQDHLNTWVAIGP